MLPTPPGQSLTFKSSLESLQLRRDFLLLGRSVQGAASVPVLSMGWEEPPQLLCKGTLPAPLCVGTERGKKVKTLRRKSVSLQRELSPSRQPLNEGLPARFAPRRVPWLGEMLRSDAAARSWGIKPSPWDSRVCAHWQNNNNNSNNNK